ncbi:MAG TPA: methyltransferase domain-containing protein [Stellaceae bacterium]|nr:methyltransferase domain-containing protein [Stellaceae bacterium]
MILRRNLAAVVARARATERVLDVGGWYSPLNAATHVIDINPFATRGRALDPEDGERFSVATWVVHDVCLAPWPFPDGYFGFSFCSHLLEDVRDPLTVVRELRRVARSGYVETPSREREIFAKGRWAGLAARIGRPPEVGSYHHRWFVEATETHLRFSAKTTELLRDRRYYLTRGDLGRKMHEAESGLGFFWDGDISAEEVIIIDAEEARQSLRRFREDAISRLR